MAHYDVVPATDEGWEHPPFAADLVGDGEEQVIWARGAIDDKGALVAILEAVESLVAAGHLPLNDVYLSFGHDEETVGTGAQAIVAHLAERGVRPALVVDEGGAVVEGIFPGVRADRRRRCQREGHHHRAAQGRAGRRPRVHSAAADRDRAPRAGDHAAERPPVPARLSETNLLMIETLGAHATGPLRHVFTRARLLNR